MNIRRARLAVRYMWTSWLNILRWASLGVLIVFLALALGMKDPGWFVWAGISGGIYLISLALFLLEAPAVRCLGCGGSLLRMTRCAKHKTAKKTLGSYTLHSTLVLATYAKSVHCPYCGMRYRISQLSRRSHREAEENARAAEKAARKATEEEARREAESKNMPYY